MAALVVALGGAAYAAIPSADGTINGCYATTNGVIGIPHSKGDLRVVDENESCRAYERTLTWSKGGPPPTAPSVVIRSAQGGLPPGERFGSVIARCEPGEIATGGGYRSSANSTAIDDTEPLNDGTGTPIGWRVGISVIPGAAVAPHAVAWAICATL